MVDDSKIFCWFSHSWFTDYHWPQLSTAAKAVYPVIAVHANLKTRQCFISQEKIALLAGITEKTVRKGIEELEAKNWLRRVTKPSRIRKQATTYLVTTPSHEKGEAFPFYKSIVTSGIWRGLTPTAKSLYPALREFSEFIHEIHEELDEGMSLKTDIYRNREFDLVHPDQFKEAAVYAGIGNSSIKPAIENLAYWELLEHDPLYEYLKIRLNPDWFYPLPEISKTRKVPKFIKNLPKTNHLLPKKTQKLPP